MLVFQIMFTSEGKLFERTDLPQSFCLDILPHLRCHVLTGLRDLYASIEDEKHKEVLVLIVSCI